MTSTIQAVKELLMKYTDPKLEHSGIMASGLAERIVKLVRESEQSMEVRMTKDHEDQNDQARENNEVHEEFMRDEADRHNAPSQGYNR